MRLIMIRHGESKMNLNKKYCGHFDSQLSKKGIMDAKNFKINYNYDSIFSSDLNRALETAKIINNKNLPILTDNRIREIDFGLFDCLDYENIKHKYPKLCNQWVKEGVYFTYPDGESIKMVQKRALNFIKEIKEKYKDCNIILVTHFGVINSILCHYFSTIDKFWSFKTNNLSEVVIKFENNYAVLERFN